MPRLVYQDSSQVEQSVELGTDPVLIGRAVECQVQTQDGMVSRRHARIVWEGGGYWIEDLGSSNGVHVGGVRIAQRAPLRAGDDVRCGSLSLRLVVERVPSPTARVTPLSVEPLVRAPAPPPRSPAPEAARPTPPPRSPAPEAASRPTPPPTAGAELAEELRAERQRRTQAEAATRNAEQRAASAEARVEEMQTRLRDLEQRAKAAEARATELEAAGKEGDRLRRRIEQLQSEVRRLRGGQPASVEGDGEALRGELEAAMAERDRLQQRVLELEAEVRQRVAAGSAAGSGPAPSGLGDAVTLLNDVLGDLRGNLRAATEEFASLMARAEQEGWKSSLTVMSDAIQQANEQLEDARNRVRELRRLLGA
ncbi:MAG TPA: FHA domain-containing protein [Polyangia bacterium]|nr:FHA domain-containing protein [Polyangia bacterium]